MNNSNRLYHLESELKEQDSKMSLLINCVAKLKFCTEKLQHLVEQLFKDMLNKSTTKVDVLGMGEVIDTTKSFLKEVDSDLRTFLKEKEGIKIVKKFDVHKKNNSTELE